MEISVGAGGWRFDNSYLKLPEELYSIVRPTPVEKPALIRLNDALAEELGLDPEALYGDEGAQLLSGNVLPRGAQPIAQAYAGHQFGYFTMLGDGRALLLGEQITPDGRRFDIVLKGSGITPYSRGGDGRAALGPMLREYIISEAMHALGIETTRSLAVVTTGEPVFRETVLPGAVLTRVAKSHIRVGTFQYAAAWCDNSTLKALADYTISRHYPQAAREENPYLAFLRAVVKSQADLISKWQLVGFIHGVMNTDNMVLSGETIDYGPCAFMDAYDPKTVFSSIDHHGRYAYGNQPGIAAWNLARFAETLLPLLHKSRQKAMDMAEAEVNRFFSLYRANWLSGMRLKLGLNTPEPEDETLIDALLDIMQHTGADFTNTFLHLTYPDLPAPGHPEGTDFDLWRDSWERRLEREGGSEVARVRMRTANPVFIPRNHRVEQALSHAVDRGDYEEMDRLLLALRQPYVYSEALAEYTALPEPSCSPYKTFCGT